MQLARPIVLVVDDDPAICVFLRRLLEQAGYTVETAADGAAGLARVEAGGIDLVLLDLMLPEMDGFELCRRVRADDGQLYVPIIMLTGLVDEAQRRTGFAAGADDYVTKPFSADELLDRVQVWLRSRQRLQAVYERLLREQERLHGLGEQLLREQERLRELGERLLSLLELWEAGYDSPENTAGVRDDLEAIASALTARIITLTRVLPYETKETDAHRFPDLPLAQEPAS